MCIIIVVFFTILFDQSPVFASKVNNLRQKIEGKNSQIAQLEAEIAEYEKEIDKVQKEANTLKNQIKIYDSTISKLNTQTSVTRNKIENTGFSIDVLTIEIAEKQNSIKQFTTSLADLLRNIHKAESQTLAEVLLASTRFSAFFDTLKYMEDLSVQVQHELDGVKIAKIELENKQKNLTLELKHLVNLKDELDSRKAITASAKVKKDQILRVTKKREKTYQELLKNKQSKKEAFEAELRAIEEELRVAIDPNSLPSPGSGILEWPLDKVFITQYFGNTPFATKNPQVYNGGGHNGIDLRASIGTPVKSALDGIVIGTGNTDLQTGCYSYGKWVLVKHENNLSTLYAHLSHINVSRGERISKKDTLGFSGNTGYSTGPHLHFTVYASEGVRIQRFSKSINCKNVDIPIAPLNSYLNPLSYL